MIEFTFINKVNGLDYSDDIYMGNDGKYYLIYQNSKGMQKEIINEKDFDITINKYHYPFYSLHD